MKTKQFGASYTVRGYLLILLIAAGAASAATNLWLGRHREINIEVVIVRHGINT